MAGRLVLLSVLLLCAQRPATPEPQAAGPRPCRPMGSAGSQWRSAPFYCLESELSPASLYHSVGSDLTLFHLGPDTGLGGPTWAGFATRSGVRVLRAGAPLASPALSECWILVWFAGARGWKDWDSPWLVSLQRRPTALRLDGGGLHLQFKGPAGFVSLLPLYGYYKPPQQVAAVRRESMAFPEARPWLWSRGLPPAVLARARYWARVSRAFPLYCRDTFSVDARRETVTLRQSFQWQLVADDWGTRPLKLAAVSPSLALAARAPRFPVRFSGRVADPRMFTPYGPYTGVEGADSFDATFHVLQYVDWMEAPDPPAPGADPSVDQALARLRDTAKGKFPSAGRYEYDHGGMSNFCWAIMGDGWYARALPYYDADTRRKALSSLRRYFHDDVLVRDRFVEREYPKGSGRRYLILEGPGIGSWGVLGDAGRFSTNLLETLWAYAQYTGDWALVKERWPLVKRLLCTGAQSRWATFGRGEIAEMGDEAPPVLALARMARKVGDGDTYAYACYLLTRELIHHAVKQMGGAYFRRYQPWHSMEAMPPEVYLTNLWGDTAGWQIDGPTYPEQTGERQYNNRWVRFKSEEVGRFYQDVFPAEIRREMDLLTQRWKPERRWQNDSHIMPSLIQLRSLLLDERPDRLARLATPDRFSGPASGVIASCLSVIRTSHPRRLVRVVPAGPPTPFATGLEREVGGGDTSLAQTVLASREGEGNAAKPAWPRPTWWGWKSPGGGRWSFGTVSPGTFDEPASARSYQLNWNTRAITFALPKPAGGARSSGLVTGAGGRPVPAREMG